MESLLPRLQERKLAQWGATYLAGAWLLLQVAGELRDTFSWPPIIVQALTILLGIGFFAALILAWYHGEKGEQRVSGPELIMLSALLFIAGALVSLIGDDNADGEGSRTAGAASGPPIESVAAVGDVERSIAVLPLTNLSGDPGNEYFSDGITEEILNALAQVPGLRVAGSYATFSFKGTGTPLSEIARQLNVGAILQGSVRREGNQVRITTSLIDTRTGEQIWTERYDAQVSAILLVQEQIAREIVTALRIRLGASAVVVRGSANPRAYDLYLRGLYDWRKRGQSEEGREAVRRAIDYMRQAVRIDSSSAYAYSGLSRVYEVASIYLADVSLAAALREADLAARRAVALDTTLADARSVLAWTLAYRHRDFAAAEREHRRAIELNPRDVWIRWAYSQFLHTVGRPDEGVRQAETAIALDRMVFAGWNALGANHATAGRYAEAEEAFSTGRASVGLPPSYSLLIHRVYIPQGRIAEARAALDSLGGAEKLPVHAAYVEAAAGRMVEARRLLAQESHDLQDRALSRAFVHVTLGERDSAFASLESWTDPGGFAFHDSPFDPRLAPLHTDARWDAFLREMRLR